MSEFLELIAQITPKKRLEIVWNTDGQVFAMIGDPLVPWKNESPLTGYGSTPEEAIRNALSNRTKSDFQTDNS